MRTGSATGWWRANARRRASALAATLRLQQKSRVGGALAWASFLRMAHHTRHSTWVCIFIALMCARRAAILPLPVACAYSARWIARSIYRLRLARLCVSKKYPRASKSPAAASKSLDA